MVIAMAGMYMVQVVTHQVIDVISVRNPLVSAMRAVLVVGGVPFAGMLRCAIVGVPLTDFYRNAVIMIAVCHVQVPVMKIGSLASVTDRHVSAGRTVNVIVFFVTMFAIHLILLP